MPPEIAIRHRTTSNVRAVLYEECGGWVGQCLEMDVAAQGKSYEDVARSLEVCLQAYDELSVERGHNCRPEPAPNMFYELWDRSA